MDSPAADRHRRSMQDDIDAYRRRIRPIYLALLVLMVVVCGYGFALMEAMLTAFGQVAWIGRGFAFVVFAPLLGFAGFLAWKPQWWAKFLLLPCGFAWTMNGAIQALPDFQQTLGGFAHLFWIPIACGLSAFTLSAIHFVLDAVRPPPGRGRLA